MDNNRLDVLLQQYFDGHLSPEDKDDLEVMLLTEPAARREFWRSVRVHTLLRLHGEAEWGRRAAAQGSEMTEPPAVSVGERVGRWFQFSRRTIGLATAGMLAIIIVALVIWSFALPQTWVQGVAQNPAEVPERNSFSEDKGVAVLKAAANVVWETGGQEHQPGETLLAGWLRLNSGAVQLEFTRGARVVLEGPAVLKLVSGGEAYLQRGRLRAHVPESDAGFRITSDAFSLVDQGTEFGCWVPPQGAPEVCVFQGKVELSPALGTWGKQSLDVNHAVAITTNSLRPVHADTAEFLTEQDLESREDLVSRDRLAGWQRQSRIFSERPGLVLHYTFENHQPWERILRNQASHASPDTDAALVGCNWVDGRWPGKGAVEFSRNDDRLRVHVPDKFKSLTYLAWLRVDSLPSRYTSLIMTESLEVGEVHWSLDAHGSLHLSARKAPPSSQTRADWEAATAFQAVKPEMEGSWIMLTSVFDADAKTVTHYVNGEPVMQKQVSFPSPLILGDIEIGNWGVQPGDPRLAKLANTGAAGPNRSFKGRMDEVALLAEPLSAAEIRALYNSGKPAATGSLAKLARSLMPQTH